MKTLYIFFLITLAVSSQAAWVTIPSGVGSDLNKIVFATADLGMAVGNDGTALRTIDGGATWQRMPMLQDIDLQDVAFLSAGTIVAVGEKHWGKAAIVVSYDSGANWFVPYLSLNEALSSVCFVNASTGYATAHGYVLRTNDGGLTWTSTLVAGTHFLTSIRFSDPMHGIVTGGTHDQLGFTMRTVDGGVTWTSDADQYIEPIKTSRSLDATHAWRIGGDFEYGAFLSSTIDGGATWSQTVLADTKLSLNDILFTDALHGIAVGGTSLLQTADGGAHWLKTTLLDNGYISSLTISPRGDVWGVGSAGRIMKQSQSPNGVPTGAAVASFTLLPNYPNPIATTTEFRFALSERTHVTMAVYAMDGSRVATVIDGVYDAGNHSEMWNARNTAGTQLPNGAYIVKLSSGETSVSRQVSVVR